MQVRRAWYVRMEEEYILLFRGEIRTVVVARQRDAERYSLAIRPVRDLLSSRSLTAVVALIRFW